jgi:hypothetical protein
LDFLYQRSQRKVRIVFVYSEYFGICDWHWHLFTGQGFLGGLVNLGGNEIMK